MPHTVCDIRFVSTNRIECVKKLIPLEANVFQQFSRFKIINYDMKFGLKCASQHMCNIQTIRHKTESYGRMFAIHIHLMNIHAY